MTAVLFLAGGALTMALQSAFKRGFTKDCPLFCSFCTAFFALLVFVFSSGFKFSFDVGLLSYAISMGVIYGTCTVCLTFALKCGDLSISGLIISASLILPTLYGIIFLHNPITVFFVIGLCVLAASLVLVNLGGKKEQLPVEQTRGFSVKWLIFILIAAVTNGFCSILQTAQQTAYNGAMKNELMIIVLSVASVLLLAASLIAERGKIKDGVKQSVVLGGGAGVMNGFLNLFVMLALEVSPAALVFPVISGVSLLMTFVIAVLFFKERYQKIQYLGYALGLLSVVLLNL